MHPIFLSPPPSVIIMYGCWRYDALEVFLTILQRFAQEITVLIFVANARKMFLRTHRNTKHAAKKFYRLNSRLSRTPLFANHPEFFDRGERADKQNVRTGTGEKKSGTG